MAEETDMARKIPTPAPPAPVRTAPYDANKDPQILAKRRAQGLMPPDPADAAPVDPPAAPAAE